MIGKAQIRSGVAIKSPWRYASAAIIYVLSIGAIGYIIGVSVSKDGALGFFLVNPLVLFMTWFAGIRFGIATALGIGLSALVGALSGHHTSFGYVILVVTAMGLEAGLLSFLFDRFLRRLDDVDRQHSRNLAVFVEQAPAAIAMFDKEMRYLAASRRWLSDFRINDPEIIGKSHYDVFPELPERWRRVHKRCLAGNTERADQELFERSDGTKQWLAWEVRPWLSNIGSQEVGGIFMYSEDITRLKLAHDNESTLYAKSEVERALCEEAEAANQLKDEFVATLSHELRTPLNAILGWVQLMKRVPRSPERIERALTAIENGAHALAKLSGDILDIHRLRTGKLRLNLETLCMHTLIARCLDTALPHLDEKRIVLERCGLEDRLLIRGDSVRLQQCFWNLLSNAIKFTPLEGIIRVESRQENAHVTISVCDTGRGILATALEQIFERFVQADPSSTRAYGGLGLGLSITRDLVRLHGGTIAACSDGQDCGSTFAITLPILQSAEAIPPIAQLPAVVWDSTAYRDYIFLVVDDELESRELLRGALEDNGAHVLTASSVTEALALTSEHRIDLIISDVAMPHRDGFALVRELRASKVFIPIVALSAHAGAPAIKRAHQAGFDRYLAKPVELEHLFATITELLPVSEERLRVYSD